VETCALFASEPVPVGLRDVRYNAIVVLFFSYAGLLQVSAWLMGLAYVVSALLVVFGQPL